MVVDELPPSKLGTQEYWDDVYNLEIQNFDETNDEGEIWFGEKHIFKILKWISKSQITKTSLILDIGCGNGVFLTKLFEEGYTELYGIDYSSNAVDLATKIATSNNCSILYQSCDFLDTSSILSNEKLPSQYDICHDKGTYDAISLRPDDAKQGRHDYMLTLQKILKNGGLFIITSCNWTLDDLKEHFSIGFQFIDHIPAPTFQFGGQTGSTISCGIFKKLSNPD